MKNKLLLSSLILIISYCFVNVLYAQSWVYGKNQFNINVDGQSREFFLHIPKSYDDQKNVPLVFMLHGTSGDGELMYNTSGWVQLSEQKGFIAVFPSSLKYKINDNGELKYITKWNTTPDADWTFQPGEVGGDDIKFLRKIIEQVSLYLKINSNRIYLNGFSNGGSMAAKCSVEMGDVLAAVCGNAAGFYLDTTYTPKRKIPYLFQIGNLDYGPGNVGPEYPAIPMQFFDTLISTPGINLLNGKHYRIANNITRNFSFKSEHTAIVGDTNFAISTTYYPIDERDPHEFKYIFVKDLGHFYPSWAAAKHWEWQEQFELSDTASNSTGKKIRVVTKLENADREYFIHIPANFDSTKEVPMVIFYHGGGQDGNLYYNISGWNQVADTANIIMVYPSSLSYCVYEDSVQKLNPQWNVGWQAGPNFCPNQKMKDDVLFTKTIIEQMSSRYKIDQNRIYALGFSNGAEFTGKLTIELSDKIAAAIMTGGGGSLPLDTVLTPKRKLPVMQMFGNKDAKMLKGLNITGSAPMGFDQLYTAYPNLYRRQITPFINAFGLDETNYKFIGDTNNIVAVIYHGKTNNPLNIFWNVEVKELEHEYPNGNNHPFYAAPYHWAWLNQFALNSPTANKDISQNANQLIITPNPANTQIIVPGIKEYHIYSLQGVLLLSGNNPVIDIHALENGMYMLKTDIGSGLFMKI